MTSDTRICFVGDSFVNGTGDETALGWAGRLCVEAYFLGTSVTYYNLGVRRNTSHDILQRWEEECVVRLPKESDRRIVFSFGVNDTVIENGSIRIPLKESCSNAKEILTQARRLEYTCLMIGPPPVFDEQHNERVKVFSEAYSHEAAKIGVPYIALFPRLVADHAYKKEVKSNDGAHPGSEGYKKIAHIISASQNWWFRAP